MPTISHFRHSHVHVHAATMCCHSYLHYVVISSCSVLLNTHDIQHYELCPAGTINTKHAGHAVTSCTRCRKCMYNPEVGSISKTDRRQCPDGTYHRTRASRVSMDAKNARVVRFNEIITKIRLQHTGCQTHMQDFSRPILVYKSRYIPRCTR